jgi:mono/diheme cytochrome c family protein
MSQSWAFDQSYLKPEHTAAFRIARFASERPRLRRIADTGKRSSGNHYFRSMAWWAIIRFGCGPGDRMPDRRIFWLTIAALFGVAASGHCATAVQRGEAVATRSGCLSCHGPNLTGRAILNDPTIATLYAANLTRVAPTYTDRQLAKVIQTGVRPDGSHLWLMAAPYQFLTKRDLADLLAYIRSLPPEGKPTARIKMGPRFLKAVRAGRLQPEAMEQARDKTVPPDFGPRFERGRYLARTICAGCHYPGLNGLPDRQAGDAPNLIVAAGYDRDQFRTLLRTGKGVGGHDLGVMSEESPKRFAQLPNGDIDAIWAYLRRRAQAH